MSHQRASYRNFTALQLPVFLFVPFDNATVSSIWYSKNHVSYFTKPKEVDLIKLISLRQTSVSIALKYIINKQRIKINRIGISMIATLSFFY